MGFLFKEGGSFRPLASIISICLIIVAITMEILMLQNLRDNLPKLLSGSTLDLLSFIINAIPMTIFWLIATLATIFNISSSARAKGNYTPILRWVGVLTFVLNIFILAANCVLLYMMVTGDMAFFTWLAELLYKMPLDEIQALIS
ncbi:MAG: hypothetical protein FWD32_00570 [Firmicutes bacterium]|nr:hypothetical protein [Bacillota bacterium]